MVNDARAFLQRADHAMLDPAFSHRRNIAVAASGDPRSARV
jgi:hypothetical protein